MASMPMIADADCIIENYGSHQIKEQPITQALVRTIVSCLVPRRPGSRSAVLEALERSGIPPNGHNRTHPRQLPFSYDNQNYCLVKNQEGRRDLAGQYRAPDPGEGLNRNGLREPFP